MVNVALESEISLMAFKQITIFRTRMPSQDMKPANTIETKSQPWRAVWPALESTSSSQLERKAGTNNGGNGLYGYNDKNEGVAPKK